MKTINLLGTTLRLHDKSDILEYLEKNTLKNSEFYHVISLNPENFMVARREKTFEEVVRNAQIHIADGTGIVWAARVLKNEVIPRITGVDLMDELLRHAHRYSLKCLLIGGKGNLANTLADCYQRRLPGLKIWSHHGFEDINNPKTGEEKEIFDIVASVRPHFVFVSFGSPWQEIWIDRHRERFGQALVMGVGGAFALLSGEIRRAPHAWRVLGLEWLWRLILEPWRWRRQLKVVQFAGLVLAEKLRERHGH